MNTLFEPWFAEKLSHMSRQMAPPVAPFRYGVDLSTGADGFSDIPDDFSEVDADSYEGLAQSLIRRLLTPRGGLIDDPSYGDGIASMINHGITVPLIAAIRQRIEDELKKDDRVDRVAVEVAALPEPLATGVMHIVIKVTANDRNQDFDLIFAATGDGHIVDVMIQEAVL